MQILPNSSSTAISETGTYQGLQIPAALEANLQRHRDHLSQLILTLRSAGIQELHIEDSVSVIVDSYKAELIQAMKELMR